jgi:hypothetical protein
MEVSGLFLYLVFLGVILVSQYLKRRKAVEQQRQSGIPQSNQEVLEKPDFFDPFDPFADDGFPTKPAPTPQKTLAQRTLVAREKPVHGSAYRSLAELQEAPAAWNTQKAVVKKSAYRAQFKDHKGIQQAVVNMVVLGPCRSDEPYQHK